MSSSSLVSGDFHDGTTSVSTAETKKDTAPSASSSVSLAPVTPIVDPRLLDTLTQFGYSR